MKPNKGRTVKPNKGKKRRYFLLLGLGLAMVALGLSLVFRAFDRHALQMRDNEDGKLMGLARSVDRSVVSYLGSQADSLIYVTGRRGFLEAESLWLTRGESEELLRRLSESLVAQQELVKAALVLRDGNVVLSTSGRTDYRFPPGAGREGAVSIGPCVDGDGTIFLAFVQETDRGLSYASLMDLKEFYQRVAVDLSTDSQDRIMLLDAGGQTLIHMAEGEIRVESTEELLRTGTGCDLEGLVKLLEFQKEGREGADFYDTEDCASGKEYTARMAVVPAASNTNGFFAVGVSINYDQFIRPMRMTAIRLLAYGGMVIAGAALLLGLVLWAARRNERALRELELLREKNEAIEAINRQTGELAHHQRLETIGTLTSSIAHEFNNLLTPIMGYSILTLEKLPPEETELYDNVLEIYSASKKAKTIITRLSELSRKNTGLSCQYVSPDELARRALEAAAPARPRRVEVKLETGCRHLWLYGNETQLSQLLLNLVLNGFSAMEERGGVLTLTTGADGEHIFFRVADTGCGIPPEVMPRIFDPFFTTKESGKGTGLGLAIVQQVAEEHGGRVTAESRVGEGTVFTVTFPIRKKGDGEDGTTATQASKD